MIDMSVVMAHGVGSGDPLGDMETGTSTAGTGLEMPALLYLPDPDPGDSGDSGSILNTLGEGLQPGVLNNGVTDPLGPDQLGTIAILNNSTFIDNPDAGITVGLLGQASVSQF